MRKQLSIAAVLAAVVALAVAGIAAAEKPVKVRAGNLELTFNGGFKPKALSKRKPTPIKFNISGKIRTLDGSHPPALKEFVLEADKNAGINVKGVPICRSGQLQSRDSAGAKAACRPAIIGTGTATAEIQFPEQAPIPVKSPLYLFNGGVRGGKTTLFLHAYITVPTPAAIVTTIKINRFKKGRYGLKSVATIPKIAGGSGSVTSFNLNITKRGVLSAKCTDGKLQASGTAKFSDGTKASATVVRPCRPKG
jgi:hypothetical protein